MLTGTHTCSCTRMRTRGGPEHNGPALSSLCQLGLQMTLEKSHPQASRHQRHHPATPKPPTVEMSPPPLKRGGCSAHVHWLPRRDEGPRLTPAHTLEMPASFPQPRKQEEEWLAGPASPARGRKRRAPCTPLARKPAPSSGGSSRPHKANCGQAPVIPLFPVFFVPSLIDESRKDDLCSFNLL